MKHTIAFPADVLSWLESTFGPGFRGEVRRIVTDDVRSRMDAETKRDPETDGTETEPAVQ